MATNFSTITASERLHIDNIHVGDTLIQANFKFGRMTETTWIVAKVLKTRLVLTHDSTTIRVLVHNSKWSMRNGEVSTRLEGQSEWSRDSYYFFTPDEPVLAQKRIEFADAEVEAKLRDAAVEAARTIVTRPKYFTKEAAEAAVAALQAFIDNEK